MQTFDFKLLSLVNIVTQVENMSIGCRWNVNGLLTMGFDNPKQTSD